MSAALLEFHGAALGYQGRAVLEGVSFSVKAGSFWGILGANGSGKTTILKTTLGLIPPIKGRVTRCGRDGGQARFGYVPQKERLDPIYPLTGAAVGGGKATFESIHNVLGGTGK